MGNVPHRIRYLNPWFQLVAQFGGKRIMGPLGGEALMEEIFLRTISLAGYLITKLLLICPNSSKSSRL